MPDSPRADLWHSWLPLALPATARRIHVDDLGLRATLEDAGAELVENGADVAIGTGNAPWVVVPVESELPQRRLVPLRVAERVLRGLSLRAKVRNTLRRLPGARVVWWEPNLPVSFGTPRGTGRARFPLRALVVRGQGDTILDAVLGDDAAEALRAKGGLTLAFLEHGVLRVAVGPARRKLELQSRALAALRALSPPDDVARLVPWELERGQMGLGEWVLETRLPGSSATAPLHGPLLDECVDFLVALFGAGTGSGELSLASRTEAIGRLVPGEAEALRALGARLDAELAPLPRGFAHADFGVPNLLVAGGRLTGVVDWEAAGDGRLPFLDLLHLEVENALRPREELGEAFARHLLPWAGGGGDARMQRYAERLGLDADAQQLERFAVAWWLDTIGYAVEEYDPATRWRRDWTERNVHVAVSALRARGMLRP